MTLAPEITRLIALAYNHKCDVFDADDSCTICTEIERIEAAITQHRTLGLMDDARHCACCADRMCKGASALAKPATIPVGIDANGDVAQVQNPLGKIAEIYQWRDDEMKIDGGLSHGCELAVAMADALAALLGPKQPT